MQVIYKYPLQITGEQSITVPNNSVLLCVKMQGDVLTAWVKQDAHPSVYNTHKIRIIATGQPFETMSNRWAYAETVVHNGLVLHIFIDGEGKLHGEL